MDKANESIKPLTPSLWESFFTLYNNCFSVWEKENPDIIKEKGLSGHYRCRCLNADNEVIALSICELYYEHHFVLFSYLAVVHAHRSSGLSRKMSDEVSDFFSKNKKQFRWLFLECEDELIDYYVKLGFSRIAIDYRPPKFNSNETVSMNLLLYKTSETLNHHQLSEIIKKLFVDSYQLISTDKRIEQQLNTLPR
ncbi:hypothetical protein SOPP22_13625 [Shewanella sp. OPT22]|nr:hypothetical protein SOPP22_13625 [Shewanella sp. OPT22]